MICMKTIAIGMHLLSWHSQEGYNNTNVGLYARNDCGLQVGAFYNSERKLSVYASYILESDKHPFFALAGVATGYRYGIVSPLGGVGIKVKKFRIMYTPKLGKHNDTHLLHLAYEF